MHTGSELVETWIPVSGFKIERRRVRTQDGGATVTECLVPKWEIDDLMADHPCARQPCLHRIVADCPPERQPILGLAGIYGLLTVSLTRTPEPGKPVPASALSPEPVDLWRREIRELKAVGDLWDRIAAGDRRGEELLELKLAAGLARSPSIWPPSARRDQVSGCATGPPLSAPLSGNGSPGKSPASSAAPGAPRLPVAAGFSKTTPEATVSSARKPVKSAPSVIDSSLSPDRPIQGRCRSTRLCILNSG